MTETSGNPSFINTGTLTIAPAVATAHMDPSRSSLPLTTRFHTAWSTAALTINTKASTLTMEPKGAKVSWLHGANLRRYEVASSERSMKQRLGSIKIRTTKLAGTKRSLETFIAVRKWRRCFRGASSKVVAIAFSMA